MKINVYRVYVYIALSFLLSWILGLLLSIVADNEIWLLQFYSILLTINSIVAVLINSKRNSSFFSAYNAVSISPIWFIYLAGLFESDAWSLQASSLIHTLCYVSFFLSCFNFCYIFRASDKVREKHKQLFALKSGGVWLGIFGIVIFSLLIASILIRYDFNIALISETYLAGRRSGAGLIKRGGIGGLEVFLQPIEFMTTSVPTIAALSWVNFQSFRRTPIPLRIALTIAALVLIFLMFLGGSRGLLAAYLAGPLMVWLVFGNTKSRRNPATYLINILLFISLVATWEIQYRFRNDLLTVVSSNNIGEVTTIDPRKSHRDGNLYIFALYHMNMPKLYPFEGFGELYYLAVNPIPRAIWAGKPKGAQESKETFSKPKGPVAEGPLTIGTNSLTQTVVGDGFKMFHYYGIAIYSALFGLLASYWDSISKGIFKNSPLIFIIHSSWLFWILWGFRAGFALVSAMYTLWGAYIFCYAVSKIGQSSFRNLKQ